MEWKELISNDKIWIPTLLTTIAFGSMYYFEKEAVNIVSTIVGVMGGIIVGKSLH